MSDFDKTDELASLCRDALALLNCFCDKQDENGNDCPAWPDRTKQCGLRDIEERAKELGVIE